MSYSVMPSCANHGERPQAPCSNGTVPSPGLFPVLSSWCQSNNTTKFMKHQTRSGDLKGSLFTILKLVRITCHICLSFPPVNYTRH